MLCYERTTAKHWIQGDAAATTKKPKPKNRIVFHTNANNGVSSFWNFYRCKICVLVCWACLWVFGDRSDDVCGYSVLVYWTHPNLRLWSTIWNMNKSVIFVAWGLFGFKWFMETHIYKQNGMFLWQNTNNNFNSDIFVQYSNCSSWLFKFIIETTQNLQYFPNICLLKIKIIK